MYNVKIIIASTRRGRKGPSVASWVYDVVKKHAAFDTELIDLAVINLPFLDEPHHPRFRKYEQQHTKDWSAKIDPADAFIFVTPEYNYGYPAPLKNALDFLWQEWNYKPVAFVSYGGIAAGTRCVQMLKQVVSALIMVPLHESVNIPFFTKHINEEGKFIPDEVLDKSLEIMLHELETWAEGMKGIRKKHKA
jgi:NAD(P)H-dependent FMN reductase